MTTKSAEFEKLLATLKTLGNGVDAFNERIANFLDEFIHLPADFDDTILSWTHNFLNYVQEDDEDEFLFIQILEGLETRDKKLAFSLASEALLNEKTEDKSFYVNFLIGLNFPETPTILIRALEQIESYDYTGGHAQEAAIDYLTLNKFDKAYPVILNCLSDEADRVRLAALRYILYLDKKEAMSKLKDMLKDEDEDEDVKKMIGKIFQKWNKKADG